MLLHANIFNKFMIILLVTPITCKSSEEPKLLPTIKATQTTTIVEYDEDQMAIRNLFTKDSEQLKKFQTAVSKFLAKGYTQGYTQGYTHGYSIGYQEGDARNFLAYFECGVRNQKTLMEVYKDPPTAAIWSPTKDKLTDKQLSSVQLPEDLKDLITQNDKWIPQIQYGTFQNGHEDDSKLFIDSAFVGTYPYPKDGNKRSVKSRSTAPFDQQQSMFELLEHIKKTAINWHEIVNCVDTDVLECPKYVKRLQKLLYQILMENVERYENYNYICWRFAIHIARSYKMMCVVHHNLMSVLLKNAVSRQKKEISFDEVLFGTAPTWMMTSEQILFLNVLKDARDVDHNEPIQYYRTENNEKQPTYVLYDSKQCPNNQINKKTNILTSAEIKYHNPYKTSKKSTTSTSTSPQQ